MAKTIDPILSVLIPSIPSRIETHLIPLLSELQRQAEGKPVEILSLLDNKTRSIGLKRDALVQSARGYRIAFVDDDDSVSPDYIDSILSVAAGPEDVVTFDQLTLIDFLPPVVVQFRLGAENQTLYHDGRYGLSEHREPGGGLFVDEGRFYPIGARRNAWHICAWKRDIGRRFGFPDSSYGEDWAWAGKCCEVGRTSVVIPRILHTYRFDSLLTEAEA